MNRGTSLAPKAPAAEEIALFAKQLADRANLLTGDVRTKLDSVLYPAQQPNDLGKIAAFQDFPPYFAELNRSLFSIQAEMDAISEILTRVAL